MNNHLNINRLNYFHLSKSSKLKILNPQIPNNILSRKNIVLEDDTIPRVCLAPTIRGCLLGLQINESDFINGEDLKLFIYRANISDNDVVSNRYIQQNKLVFDSAITGEVWSLEPVNVSLIGEVICSPYNVSEPKEIKYFPILLDAVKDQSEIRKFLGIDGYLHSYVPRYQIITY